MDEEGISEAERLQIQLIRELDMEELQVEEVDDRHHFSSDEDGNDSSGHADVVSGSYGSFTFNISLASQHTYLGEVDDTHGRTMSLDGGVTLTLPLFYLEGVVLFPEATLPLRVIDLRLKAALERAMNQTDGRYTIAVIRVLRQSVGESPRFASIGTTAEIRRYKRLDDGSLNVVARGQQRFHLRRCWIDADGVPCAELQIIEEDKPLRTPRDAFAQLASVTNPSCSHSLSHALLSDASPDKHQYEDEENDWECISNTSPDHSVTGMGVQQPVMDSPVKCGRFDYCASSDEDFEHEQKRQLRRSFPDHRWQHNHEKLSYADSTISDIRKVSSPVRLSSKGGRQERSGVFNEAKCSYRAPMSFWPHWVYQMYDSFSLARKAADLWKQIIGAPSMDNLVKKPDLLSFHIASKLPLSESTRQELLEIHGISYRLRKEIQLLECFNHVRCKNCRTLIGNRSDMVVMSSDGPLNAYVNPHGYVHEIMTLNKVTGLALRGSPVKEHSWFPGYECLFHLS
uniref:Protein cereblon n=1 Tax=Anthurium amnicola TaxID=1678845 RepID=A0A1D1YFS3_9ARAE